jgi:hypothetical protein
MTTERPVSLSRIDKDSLPRRYAEERDKRLRPDGNDQYLRLTGDLAHYLDDPYTPWTERVPLTEHRTVVCVGGGFAGLVTAVRLREAGQRAGIIGTGATAVQVVPRLARDCRELYVFQRTPSSVDVRNNHPINPHWFAEVATPGWQRRWLENFTANQSGMRTLHGIHTRGFPNLLFVQPTQGANLISNVPHNIVDSAQTIAATIRHAVDNGFGTVEPSREAEDAWVTLLLSGAGSTIGGPDCTPGYYNNEGQGTGVFLGRGYPYGASAYFSDIDKWRASGTFDGLEFR